MTVLGTHAFEASVTYLSIHTGALEVKWTQIQSQTKTQNPVLSEALCLR